jgi:2-polyprenyl-3-methyl-5-hydroxy-6-metoxy-1,4-benzoquinol methylase
MKIDDYEFYAESFDILDTQYSEWLEEKTLLLNSLLEGKKIIEVGCGSGLLLQYVPKSFDITGVDFSQGNLDKAKEKNPHVSFFKADLNDKNDWVDYSEGFDTVLCSEVVEHIENDKTAMEILYSLVKPGGVLVLTVPAFNLLFSEFDRKEGHFRRYSKKQISSLIEHAGFRIEQCRYWNVMGFLGWFFFIKILNLNLKKSSNSVFSTIMGKFLKLERKTKFPLGQTIIVKARKPF